MEMETSEGTDLNALNAKVQERFKEIRARVLQIRTAPLATNLIERLSELPETANWAASDLLEGKAEEVKEIRKHTDATLDFIASMNLPNTLALAAGYIFAFNETKNKSYLTKAIVEINREVDTFDGTD